MSQTNFSSSPADWDARYLASQSVWSLEPNQFVVEDLNDLAPGNMVDVAGGEGRNALWFASRGWQVTNVEFSEVALQKFRERAAASSLEVASILGDAQDANYGVDPNLVVFAYLQLPWDQLLNSLDNALRQQTNGVIYGVWHAKENLAEGYGGPQNPAVLPSESQLKVWLYSHGLKGEVRNRTREVQTDQGVRTAIDVTLLVRR